MRRCSRKTGKKSERFGFLYDIFLVKRLVQIISLFDSLNIALGKSLV